MSAAAAISAIEVASKRPSRSSPSAISSRRASRTSPREVCGRRRVVALFVMTRTLRRFDMRQENLTRVDKRTAKLQGPVMPKLSDDPDRIKVVHTYGVGLHTDDPAPDYDDPRWQQRQILDFVDFAVEAEELGFDGLTVTEHHARAFACPAPHLLLAAAATRTSRIRLGTAVTVLPLYNPIRVAEEAGTLDALSDGRFELGLGRGIPGEVGLTLGRVDARRRVHATVDRGGRAAAHRADRARLHLRRRVLAGAPARRRSPRRRCRTRCPSGSAAQARRRRRSPRATAGTSCATSAPRRPPRRARPPDGGRPRARPRAHRRELHGRALRRHRRDRGGGPAQARAHGHLHRALHRDVRRARRSTASHDRRRDPRLRRPQGTTPRDRRRRHPRPGARRASWRRSRRPARAGSSSNPSPWRSPGSSRRRCFRRSTRSRRWRSSDRVTVAMAWVPSGRLVLPPGGTRVGQRRQRPLEFLPTVGVLRRDAELLAEVFGILVAREAGRQRGQLEPHA